MKADCADFIGKPFLRPKNDISGHGRRAEGASCNRAPENGRIWAVLLTGCRAEQRQQLAADLVGYAPRLAGKCDDACVHTATGQKLSLVKYLLIGGHSCATERCRARMDFNQIVCTRRLE